MKILGFSHLTRFWIDLAYLEELLKLKILVLFHLLSDSIQKDLQKGMESSQVGIIYMIFEDFILKQVYKLCE